jgi:hypothetical protein
MSETLSNEQIADRLQDMAGASSIVYRDEWVEILDVAASIIRNNAWRNIESAPIDEALTVGRKVHGVWRFCHSVLFTDGNGVTKWYDEHDMYGIMLDGGPTHWKYADDGPYGDS